MNHEIIHDNMSSSQFISADRMVNSKRLIIVTGIILLSSLISTPTLAQTARYRMEIDNTWSTTTHPGAFPFEAHFSWFGGATHNDNVRFWQEGQPASPGMKQMAEIGETGILVNEVNTQITAGNAGSVLNWQHWFCPDQTNSSRCGPTTVEFEIDEDFPLVTLVSMLGPSPDWFVGVSGLALRENERWLSRVEIDLYPYDGGTRAANRFMLFGPLTVPPDPISLITTQSGQLIGPSSLGTMTFTLIPEPSTTLCLLTVGCIGLIPRRRLNTIKRPQPI